MSDPLCSIEDLLLSADELTSLHNIFLYLEAGERRDWENANRPENHIYQDCLTVKSILDRYEFPRTSD